MSKSISLRGAVRNSAGIVRLEDLYVFATKHRKNEDAPRIEDSDLGREYTQLCDWLVRDVPDAQGIYLWGLFDKKRCWHNIYLGKAGFGKGKSLKRRICEELKDERAFLWRAFFDEQKLDEIRKTIHPKKNYTWSRPKLKAGSTHILWVSVPAISSRSIKPIEAHLIEALNPVANLVRPTPSGNLQRQTVEIFKKFRHLVRESRNDSRVLTQLQETDLMRKWMARF